MTEKTFNEWADFWYYEIGVNVLPLYSKNKGKIQQGIDFVKLPYKQYMSGELPEEIFNEWKNRNLFDDGIGIIGGKVYRGKHKNEYLIMLDLDNQRGIDVYFPSGLDTIKNSTLTEQHLDMPYKAHVYFYSDISFAKKTNSSDTETNNGIRNNIVPALEIKGEGAHGIHVVSPSIHAEGHQYEIVSSVLEPKFLNSHIINFEAKVDSICRDHNIPYLSALSGEGNTSLIPIKDLLEMHFGEGTGRRPAMLRVAEHFYRKMQDKIDEPNTHMKVIKKLDAWQKLHCTPVLSSGVVQYQAECARKYIIDHKKNGTLYPNIPDKKDTKVSDLMQCLHDNIKRLVISQHDSNKVYALIESNGHNELYDLDGRPITYWMRATYYKVEKEVLGEDAYKNALSQIKSNAIHDPTTTREIIYSRIAMRDDKIYYDLTSKEWEIIEISENGWEKMQMGVTTPIFKRSARQQPQMEPLKAYNPTALNDFLTLIKFPHDDKELFKAHIITMFLQGFPVPIMGILGEQGSIKSTISSFVKRIVDPSGLRVEDNLETIPKDPMELYIKLANQYMCFFDNTSQISNATSDDLCRAVTGTTFAKRELYTNAEEIMLPIMSKLGINGITPNFDHPDLIERTIFYNTTPIAPNDRITANESNIKFNELLPHILGQIFDILSQAMRIYPKVRLEVTKLPRMSDFATWAECIYRLTGAGEWQFGAYYRHNQEEYAMDSQEGNPLLLFIQSKLEGGKVLDMSMRELHSSFKIWAINEGIEVKGERSLIPKTASALGLSIRRNAPILRMSGITHERYRNTTKLSGVTIGSTMFRASLNKRSTQPRTVGGIDTFGVE